MARWLRSRGIAEERIIVENKAMSTTQNAQRVYTLLTRHYPQVTSLAIVTSDYHIHRSCAMFTTMAHWEVANGGRELMLVSNAVNTTKKQKESLESQAAGICIITGVEYNPTPETQPELAD